MLDIVNAFKKASGQDVPYKIGARRDGDLAIVFSDPSKAKAELSWEAKFGIEKMCEDTWRWQKNNPNGYEA